jgi:hypothetical protein
MRPLAYIARFVAFFMFGRMMVHTILTPSVLTYEALIMGVCFIIYVAYKDFTNE